MRLTLAVLATFSLGATLAAADFTGTWKLNMEKSKLSTDNPRASETMTISQTGPNTYTTAFDIVTKSGENRHQEVKRIYDGKEHPVEGVNVKAEGISEVCEQINISTRKITRKRDGKVTGMLTSTVAPDRKTMTNTQTMTNTRTGTKEVLVYDRQ